MMNTNVIFIMMLGTAMIEVLNSSYADDVLTVEEHNELLDLAAQFIRGDATVTKEQEELVNKIMERNNFAD